MTEFYAITRKSDGAWLPHLRGSKAGRGFTFTEPSLVEPPRLFTSKNAASVALTWWLRGHFYYTEVPCRSSYESFYDDDVTVDVEVKPQPDRRREDFKVVALTLTPV